MVFGNILGLSPEKSGPSGGAVTDLDRLNRDAPAIRELVQSINQAQALNDNITNLSKARGSRGLAKILQVKPLRGIELDSIETRRAVFGANEMESAPRATFWELFLKTFDDATLQILIVAAIVSLAIGMYDDPAAGYVEGCAILSAVLIVSVVTALNDYQKESQFRELSAANDNVDVVVIRGGLHRQISKCDIVVGDIVCVEAGDEIPCDGVLVRADGLQVDESALTGEPMDIDKDLKADCFMLSGCTVEGGSGQFVAMAVGKDSQWGIIKSHLETEQGPTPLQEKLDDMAAMIGYVGIAAAGATFIAMMFIKVVVQPDYLKEISTFSYALEAFIIGVTIVVVAVPEGLPLAVTISLAFSTKKMLADQNLIRHLAACETMGNATNICSDKTGTLTENRMTVIKGIFADTLCDDCVNRIPLRVSKTALNVILECISCCSTAKVLHPTPADDAGITDIRPQVIGNKTESAMLLIAQTDWASNADTDQIRARARFGEIGGGRLFPFSSARKCMSVLVPMDEGNWRLYHKGAAEVVLKQCSTYLDIDGSEKKLTAQKKREFEDVIKEFSSQALRCVALAHRNKIQTIIDPQTCSANECEKWLEKDLCFDAVCGIMDPLRADVIDAVATCQRAGIFVRMVTGDNIDTARAIAKEAGILTGGKLSDRYCVRASRLC
jgi:Ca2+-transporting ATPase